MGHRAPPTLYSLALRSEGAGWHRQSLGGFVMVPPRVSEPHRNSRRRDCMTRKLWLAACVLALAAGPTWAGDKPAAAKPCDEKKGCSIGFGIGIGVTPHCPCAKVISSVCPAPCCAP